MQPGPLYFLVPRKCGIFGVCCEGLPRQMNFLVDEAHLTSKGSNSVVSYMHYIFERFELGKTDNCLGQNKNRFVLCHCAWRVASGLYRSMMLNFLVMGHMKFFPASCFGLLKRAFRRHAISSLCELETVVNGSACLNSSQLAGTGDRTSHVPTSRTICGRSTDLCPGSRRSNTSGIIESSHMALISDLHLRACLLFQNSVDRFDSVHPGIVFTRTVLYKTYVGRFDSAHPGIVFTRTVNIMQYLC